MVIEVSLVISLISVSFAVLAGILAIRRNNRMDDQKYQSEITTVIVKLENIADDTKEIKEQIRGLDDKVQNLDRRVTIVEAKADRAHDRLDATAGSPRRSHTSVEDLESTEK